MKILLNLSILFLLFISCNKGSKNDRTNDSEIHQAIVQEVLHVREYTYLRVLENGQEKWIAAPITTAETGKTYYYGKTMEMKNFESKDLNKTFPTIYFVEKISETEADAKLPVIYEAPVADPHMSNPEAIKPVIEKASVQVENKGDAISLADLFKNKESYQNKMVTIKGEVTKFNPAIMKTNWIHLQDGTDFNGEFDLTATTSAELKVGDVVTLKGKVTLNKDFGAGYFYAIILEDAQILN
ncbi:OB-fold nucleic acid binding domain-containing protein [Lutimonas vermicola]|uniref:OB-fold nucleic acid binding domain-containing protein n=1 Tax=Lutimonas vermicola TaxID=414288 RepID=A0ABU9KY33_9FLAO